MTIDYRPTLAHRISREMFFGPIPNRAVVMHTCDVRYPRGDKTSRRCVNPDHLRLGTHSDNMADMVAKSRQAIGPENGQSRLTEDLVREIRSRYARGDGTHRSLGDEYGVSDAMIGHIVRKRFWAHVD